MSSKDKNLVDTNIQEEISPSVLKTADRIQVLTLDDSNLTNNLDNTTCRNVDNAMIHCSHKNRFNNFEKLRISFDGKSCPLEFLTRLEELKPLKGFSDEECLLALPLLMTGFALKWFRSRKSDIRSWSHFKVLFIEQFMPRNYDIDLEQRLRSRKQKSQETLSEFITELLDMSSKLIHPLPESVMVELVKYNMSPEYTSFLVGRNFYNLSDLLNLGKDIEIYSLKNKSISRFNKIEAVSSQALTCAKCKLSGHTYRSCRKFPGVICFKCHKAGVTTSKCACSNLNTIPSTSKVVMDSSKNM